MNDAKQCKQTLYRGTWAREGRCERKAYNPYSKTSSATVLARRYGVNQTVISKIVNGQTWRHTDHA